MICRPLFLWGVLFTIYFLPSSPLGAESHLSQVTTDIPLKKFTLQTLNSQASFHRVWHLKNQSAFAFSNPTIVRKSPDGRSSAIITLKAGSEVRIVDAQDSKEFKLFREKLKSAQVYADIPGYYENAVLKSHWYQVQIGKTVGYIASQDLAILHYQMDWDGDGRTETILFNFKTSPAWKSELKVFQGGVLIARLDLSPAIIEAWKVKPVKDAVIYQPVAFFIIKQAGFSPPVVLFGISFTYSLGFSCGSGKSVQLFSFQRNQLSLVLEHATHNSGSMVQDFKLIFPLDKGGQPNQILIRERETDRGEQTRLEIKPIRKWERRAFIKMDPAQ